MNRGLKFIKVKLLVILALTVIMTTSVVCAFTLGFKGDNMSGIDGANQTAGSETSRPDDGSVDPDHRFPEDYDPGLFARVSGLGTAASPYMITGSSDWTDIVMISRSKGADTVVYAELANDWVAEGGSFGRGYGFGTTYADASEGGILVPAGSNISLDLKGHTIDRHLSTPIVNGQVIRVEGTFEIKDSSGNNAGLITGGFSNSETSAGGIYLPQSVNAHFTFSSGTISGNKSVCTGLACGGIYADIESTVVMSGGVVSDNIGRTVGGIYVRTATLHISGGLITNNISGSSNTGLAGGGIRASVIYFSGSPKVTGNIMGATLDLNTGVVTPNTGRQSEVCFTAIADPKLYIEGPLGDDASIGIEKSNNDTYTFTSGYGAHNATVNPKHFFATNPAQSIGITEVNGQKEIQLTGVRQITTTKPATTWSDAVYYSVNNNVQVRVRLETDWTASSGSFGTGIGFGYSAAAGSGTGGLCVPTGASIQLDLNGHTLNRGLTALTNRGSVIYVGGTLDIYDSSGNNSGKITGGFTNTRGDGGGITCLGSTSVVTLYAGTISGNRGIVRDWCAGGICTGESKATIIMEGGVVENNVSTYTGGIYGPSNGSVYLRGGVITGNIGGTLGGRSGGVRASSIYLSGDIRLYDNKAGASISADGKTVSGGYSNDITLINGNALLYVEGKFQPGARIGIIYSNQTIPYTFTRNYGKYNTEDPATYFFATKYSETSTAEFGIEAIGTGTATEARIITANSSGTTNSAMAEAWSKVINDSISGNKQVYFKLSANWTATSGSFGTGVGFGSFANENNDAANGTSTTGTGHLCVPRGANIVLDLNGFTINRGLTASTSNGKVIYVNGTLTITDTSSSGSGKITGGWAPNHGGGVGVTTGSTLNFVGGTITGNRATYGGGIGLFTGATCHMSGGTVSGNIGSNGAAGVYVRDGIFYMSGGTISGNSTSGAETLSTAVAITTGKAYISGGRDRKSVV